MYWLKWWNTVFLLCLSSLLHVVEITLMVLLKLLYCIVREDSGEQSRTFLELTHSEMLRSWGRPWRALVSAIDWDLKHCSTHYFVVLIYFWAVMIHWNLTIWEYSFNFLLLFLHIERYLSFLRIHGMPWIGSKDVFLELWYVSHQTLWACLCRNWWASHHRLTGEPLQQAACASAPILQNCLWEGNMFISIFEYIPW